MATPTTLYGVGTHATLAGMTNAHTFVTSTGGTDTNRTYATASFQGAYYVHLRGTAGYSTGSGSIPTSPDGQGFLLDTAELEGQTIPAGDWVFYVGIGESANQANIYGDVAINIWKRTAAGDYTLIGSQTGSDTGELTTG